MNGYAAVKRAEMRDEWLKNCQYRDWQFTGVVTACDRTVVTCQSDVKNGCSWFNNSNESVVNSIPGCDEYYSLSVFDMNYFMEAEIVNCCLSECLMG